jgi:hypothetical protein
VLDFHISCYLSYMCLIRFIKSRRMRKVMHLTLVRENKNVFKVFFFWRPMTMGPLRRRKHTCEDKETVMKQSWAKGRVSRAVTWGVNLSGAVTRLWNNRTCGGGGGGNSSFHKQKNFLENYPQIGASALRIFASPLLGRKSLKNIGLKGRQIINVPRAPTCLGPVLS